MKTFITLKNSLIATTSVAAIGLTGLWAQDTTNKDTGAAARGEATKPTQAQSDSQKEEFRGRLVSLVTYFGQDQSYATNKGRDDKAADTGSAETATASKTTSMHNQPLGLLLSSSSSGQIGQTNRTGQTAGQTAGQTGQPGQTGGTAGASSYGQELCILLFDTSNQHLATKAQTLTGSGDGRSVGTRSGAIVTDDPNKSARGDQSSENKSASGTKDSHGYSVSVKGRKVTRDGVTAIFVEDIEQSSDVTGTNR